MRNALHHLTPILALAFAGLLLIAPLTFAEKPDPYAKRDNAWISIGGTVKSVTADSFLLDYGTGSVTVEMDDGDRDADGYKLMSGDKVMVNGRVDDDFWETTTIEAASVYVEKLNTYFYASSVDEEDALITVTSPIVVSSAVIQGVVTEVSAEEFLLDTGLRSLRVEVEEMPYNPLDDEGYQKIEIGDIVSVTGTMDDDFLEGREFVAETVTKIHS